MGQKDGMICYLLLARFITSPSFNFISYMEVEISWGAQPPSMDHVRRKELYVQRVNMFMEQVCQQLNN